MHAQSRRGPILRPLNICDWNFDLTLSCLFFWLGVLILCSFEPLYKNDVGLSVWFVRSAGCERFILYDNESGGELPVFIAYVLLWIKINLFFGIKGNYSIAVAYILLVYCILYYSYWNNSWYMQIHFITSCP